MKMTVEDWRQYDALRDLVEALEHQRSIDNWPKAKRERAAQGLRMFLGLPVTDGAASVRGEPRC